MNRPKRRGLVLGKFAPLHRGHQFLIESALENVDELVALVYDAPEETGIPLDVRAGWIRTLYPRVHVIEGWDGPRESGRDPRIMRAQEDYILRVVPQPVTHFISSEWYGGHVSRALGAEDVRVDMERARFPVSGTLVRASPFRYREFIHPIVYRDLIAKVVFLGAESTGKTTLARRMAEAFGTRWMPEYGREYWERHNVGGRLTPEQLVAIAEGHLEREEALLQESDRYLFVDTNALTTAMFARHYHSSVHPRLEALAMSAETRYDRVFVCGDEIPYDEDGTRSGDEHRHRFQREILSDLERRGVPCTILRGCIEERVDAVRGALRLPSSAAPG